MIESNEATANCPVCGVSVPERNINSHLDACLQQIEDENSRVIPVPKISMNWNTEEEKTQKVKFSRKMAPPELHTLSSSEDSNDSLPDLHTRLQKNVQSNIFSHQSSSTTHNSPFKTHTLSSDDEVNTDCWKKKVLDDVHVEEDEISIIEDYTQGNTSKGPLNVILDDVPDIEYYGSPTVTSKSSSSQNSSGVRSSGCSTYDSRSIGSSSSFGDREMEKENFGVKRSINCLDEEDELPVIHDASVNFESNPVLFNHKENYMDILPIPKKATNKKLRSEEIREEKAEKKRQREALKQQKEADKARLKAQKEAEKTASRQFKPGECMKHMVINIDRRLLECVAGSQIISQMQTAELRYRVVDHAVHSAITIMRVDPLSLSEQLEEEGVVVMDVENFVTAVWQQVHGGGAASAGGLTSLYRDLVQKLKIKRLTLVVYDIETYLRGNKNSNNRQFRANVLGEEADGASKKGKKKKSQSAPENLPKVSRIDIESALVTAQLECGLNHRLFGSPDKVGLFVTQLTKAVAEAPHKREKKRSNLFMVCRRE